MCRRGWGGYITPARAPHPPTRSPTHEDAIDQDSPSVVSRHPLGNLELKKIPEPSIFRPFPPSSIPSAPVSNSQAGDGDVAGVPGVKWLGYAQEASNEYHELLQSKRKKIFQIAARHGAHKVRVF